MPQLMARKAYCAREKLKKAFTRFYNSGSSSMASDLIKASHEANSRHGVSHADQGAFELTTCIGLLVNTAPALYWTLLYVYSDQNLLSSLRDEVSSLIQNDGDSRYINVKRCKEECKLLYSTFQEVLRLHASSLSSRVVTEDTIIKDEIRLRRNSIVHIPSAVLHRDPNHWGPDADEFDPHRFLETSSARRRSLGATYRPFAGGSTLCPGRHLATQEILSIVAMVILKFDLIPGHEKWVIPPPFEGTLTTTVLPPLNDTRVRFQPRENPQSALRFVVI
jgi:cytochrome P450